MHEEPQTDETRAAAKAAASVRRQTGGSARAELEPRPDAQLTSAQALDVARTFPTLVKAHVRKADDGVVTQRQLESMLSDAIDIVKDQDEESGDAPRSSGHAAPTARAYMMNGCGSLGAQTPQGRHRLYHPMLETVDPSTDTGVFAMLDEGCNMSCHGR